MGTGNIGRDSLTYSFLFNPSPDDDNPGPQPHELPYTVEFQSNNYAVFVSLYKSNPPDEFYPGEGEISAKVPTIASLVFDKENLVA